MEDAHGMLGHAVHGQVKEFDGVRIDGAEELPPDAVVDAEILAFSQPNNGGPVADVGGWAEQFHERGVALGLREFGQVLGAGPGGAQAKAGVMAFALVRGERQEGRVVAVESIARIRRRQEIQLQPFHPLRAHRLAGEDLLEIAHKRMVQHLGEKWGELLHHVRRGCRARSWSGGRRLRHRLRLRRVDMRQECQSESGHREAQQELHGIFVGQRWGIARGSGLWANGF